MYVLHFSGHWIHSQRIYLYPRVDFYFSLFLKENREEYRRILEIERGDREERKEFFWSKFIPFFPFPIDFL